MAIYEASFYGLSQYGNVVLQESSVEPFTALPVGYNTLQVTFSLPTTAVSFWSRCVLLRGKTGYASSPSDGVVLFDEAPSYLPTQFTDDNLSGGAYYYYSLWVYDNRYQVPVLAGVTSGLALTETGIADQMWSLIPTYLQWQKPGLTYSVTDSETAVSYKQSVLDENGNAIAFNPNVTQQDNPLLRSLLGVLAWGEDLLKNYENTLMWANDPTRVHDQDLQSLAAQMGVDYEPAIPGFLMRSKVANAAILARERGTLAGLRHLAELCAGWPFDMSISNNLFLTREASEFANPTFPEWNWAVNYPIGSVVQYIGRIMTAQAGAYGWSEAPPNPPDLSNSFWKVTTDADVTNLMDPATNTNFAFPTTWSYALGAAGTPTVPRLSSGVSSPADSVGQESNSIRVTNTGAFASDLYLWGVNQAATNQKLARVEQSIPIPQVHEYDPTGFYEAGRMALWKGVAWQCIFGAEPGQSPSAVPELWQQVGFDGRPILEFSGYTSAAMSGVAGTGGGVTTSVGPTTYYDNGNPGPTLDTTSLAGTVLTYATFNRSDGQPDVTWAGGALTTTQGSFNVWTNEGDARVLYPTNFAVKSFDVITATIASLSLPSTTYGVAVTFMEDPVNGFKQALILHYQDTSNYYYATKTGVSKVTAGVTTTINTWSTPLIVGDRLQATLSTSTDTATFTGLRPPASGNGPMTTLFTTSQTITRLASNISHGVGSV